MSQKQKFIYFIYSHILCGRSGETFNLSILHWFTTKRDWKKYKNQTSNDMLTLIMYQMCNLIFDYNSVLTTQLLQASRCKDSALYMMTYKVNLPRKTNHLFVYQVLTPKRVCIFFDCDHSVKICFGITLHTEILSLLCASNWIDETPWGILHTCQLSLFKRDIPILDAVT